MSPLTIFYSVLLVLSIPFLVYNVIKLRQEKREAGMAK